jgi:hypothetical protein
MKLNNEGFQNLHYSLNNRNHQAKEKQIGSICSKNRGIPDMHTGSLWGGKGRYEDFDIEETPWPVSASELYRLSDRRLSAKLVSTFADREMSRSQRNGSLKAVISLL